MLGSSAYSERYEGKGQSIDLGMDFILKFVWLL